MEKILGKEISDAEWDYLMCEQTDGTGKELKVVDSKVVAVDHEPTQEELLQKELNSLEEWFNEYDNQVKQYERCLRLGVEFDKNIEELDAQATINQKRISEIRNLLKGE